MRGRPGLVRKMEVEQKGKPFSISLHSTISLRKKRCDLDFTPPLA